MREKLAVLVATLLLTAAPAFVQIGGVASLSDSEFSGPDTAQVGGYTAAAQSDFFDGGIL